MAIACKFEIILAKIELVNAKCHQNSIEMCTIQNNKIRMKLIVVKVLKVCLLSILSKIRHLVYLLISLHKSK